MRSRVSGMVRRASRAIPGLLGTSLVALAAVVLPACSGSTTRFEQPSSWRFNDRDAAGPDRPYPNARSYGQSDYGSDYEYRGGRDPATGVARRPSWSPTGSVAAAPLPAPMPDYAGSYAGRRSEGYDYRTIYVQPGDTIEVISQRHNVPVAALMEANRLDSPYVVPGQRLLLPRS